LHSVPVGQSELVLHCTSSHVPLTQNLPMAQSESSRQVPQTPSKQNWNAGQSESTAQTVASCLGSNRLAISLCWKKIENKSDQIERNPGHQVDQTFGQTLYSIMSLTCDVVPTWKLKRYSPSLRSEIDSF